MARPAYTEHERSEIEAQIRGAALGQFDKVGYRGASLRAIAKELGWSATALYQYFENKEALFNAVRADGFKQMQETLRAARGSSKDALETAANAARAYLDFAVQNRPLYQLMYELDQGEVAEDPIVRAERRAAFAQAEAIAEDVIEQTALRRSANEIAHLLWVAAHGLAALHVANQLDLGQDAASLIDPVLSTIIQGLLAETPRRA